MRRRGLPALPALLPSLAHNQPGGVQLVIPHSPGAGHDIGAASPFGATQVARMSDKPRFGHAPMGRRRSAQ